MNKKSLNFKKAVAFFLKSGTISLYMEGVLITRGWRGIGIGMSPHEVKSVIRSQILLVFFLPILLAVVHICFAFNIIRKMLLLLELTNVVLFIGCTAATVAIFAIVYAIVYSLTAKTYYRITYSN
ncbi:MAG: hypothetical protein PUC12_04380 [Clostridiales bacterium]|nr:hypothetical protein [Clostridiales bacterium]